MISIRTWLLHYNPKERIKICKIITERKGGVGKGREEDRLIMYLLLIADYNRESWTPTKSKALASAKGLIVELLCSTIRQE